MAESYSNVPLRKGINYAPLRPLLTLQDEKPKTSYLADCLKERWKHYYHSDKNTWSEMIRVGKLTGQMLQGDQLLVPNPWTNGWLVIKPPREDDSTERALNLMQFYVSNCISKDLLSNPDVVVKPGRDTDESEEAAKAAAIIVDHYEEKFFDPWFTIQECLLKYCFGTWITRLRHDTGIKGAVALREITENRTITLGEGAGWCGECGHGSIAQDFIGQFDNGEAYEEAEVCPQCGSGAVMVDRPPSAEMPVVVGQEEVQLGDFCLDELPFPFCRWDLYCRPEESAWFAYQRNVPLGAIRRILGRVRIPGGTNEQDLGLNVANALAKSGLSLSGRGKRNHQQFLNKNEVALCELWLSPDDLIDMPIRPDEETVAGAHGQADAVPEGATWADVFPEGAVAVGLNGMAVVLGFYDEQHCDRIASGVWHAKPMSGAGRGVQDMVEVQKRLNRFDSQTLDYMDSAATPATLAIKGAVEDDQAGYLGKPRSNIMVELSKIPEGKGLSDVVQFMPAQSVPGQMVQYVQQFLTQAFSTTSHQTDFSNGGLMENDNDTATGSKIADANAKSVVAPMMAVKAGHRKTVAKQVIKYYPQCFPIERYFPLGGKHGKQQGKYLSGLALQDADLRFEVTPESELPQNSETKINRTLNFFGLFGGFVPYMQAKQADPVRVANLEKLWNVQLDDDADYDNTSQLGRRILDQMQAAYEMAQQQLQQAMAMMAQMPPLALEPEMDDTQEAPEMEGMGMEAGPEMLMGIDPASLLAAIQPPLLGIEPDLQGLIQYFRNWTVGEGLEASNELRQAVAILVQQIFMMNGVQQTAIASQQGMAQAAANPQGGNEGPPQKKEKKAA